MSWSLPPSLIALMFVIFVGINHCSAFARGGTTSATTADSAALLEQVREESTQGGQSVGQLHPAGLSPELNLSFTRRRSGNAVQNATEQGLPSGYALVFSLLPSGRRAAHGVPLSGLDGASVLLPYSKQDRTIVIQLVLTSNFGPAHGLDFWSGNPLAVLLQ
eukprot:1416291-Pleurochrysis_carterae.AAC.1